MATKSTSTPPRTVALSHFAVGLVFLLVAVGSTLMLVLKRIASLSLPGCGPGSPCAMAAASAWGKVPIVKWPVSHLGFTFFAALLVGWLLSRKGISPALRLMTRLGVIASLIYVIVIAVEGHYCMYCLVAHAANFAFWIVLELSSKSALPSFRPFTAGFATFVLLTVALYVGERNRKESVQAKGREQLADSTEALIRATSHRATGEADASSTSVTTTAPSTASPKRWPNGFTGRHRLGPENAPIRIVMLSDYQCPDCQRVEHDVSVLMAGRNDISLTFKHFPMCKDCNHHISMTLHANACWAARAAEAAGILRGEEGFWQMHRWLFENKGKFEDKAIKEAVKSMGYDPLTFIQVMTDDNRTLPPVREDVDDGQWLGIHYTPMVFVNGVEVRGAAIVPGAVPQAVSALAATNPPPMTCANDQPPPAADKYLADWRANPVQMLPAPIKAWPIGADDAKIKVTVWGDLQEPNSIRVDSFMRDYIARGGPAQYTFRNYPVNQACNPSSQVTKHPQACLAHKAAIAAGLLGGADAYWKMHKWLTANQSQVNEETIKQNAYQMGLDVPRLLQTMESPEVSQIMLRDGQAGRAINLTAVPTIFINGRFVPRWLREGDDILGNMLKEAGM